MTAASTADGTDPALRFRRAGAEDWAALWPIWRQIVLAGDTYCYDPETTSERARDGWLAARESVRQQAWLAPDSAGAVFGTFHRSLNQQGPGRHVVNGSYMVAERARGRGVGRSMVTHSLARAAAADHLAMQFNAVAATNVHAVRLDEDLGSRTVGRVPGALRHPIAGLVDLQIMHREL
ncbi:MAG: putative acetyltransferase [Frankiales bacterium]|nr:putative acetyltransferase [Frankiales bacterium]